MSKLSRMEFVRHEPALHRLFFGFLPDRAAWSKTVAVGNDVRERAGIDTPLRANLLHSTLLVARDMALFEETEVERCKTAGDRIANEGFPPFRLEFYRASRADKDQTPQPLVLVGRGGHKPFRTIQKAMVRVLVELQLPPLPHGLSHPHVTLLYGRGPVDLPVTPLAWDITELALVYSRVGLGEHEVLARWPLRRTQDLFG